MINDENHCYDCKSFPVTILEQAVMVCPKCGKQVIAQINDPPTKNN